MVWGLWLWLVDWVRGDRWVLDECDGRVVLYGETVTLVFPGEIPSETLHVDCWLELYSGIGPEGGAVIYNGYAAYRRYADYAEFCEALKGVSNDLKEAGSD